jgi:hypothetical protein
VTRREAAGCVLGRARDLIPVVIARTARSARRASTCMLGPQLSRRRYLPLRSARRPQGSSPLPSKPTRWRRWCGDAGNRTHAMFPPSSCRGGAPTGRSPVGRTAKPRSSQGQRSLPSRGSRLTRLPLPHPDDQVTSLGPAGGKVESDGRACSRAACLPQRRHPPH